MGPHQYSGKAIDCCEGDLKQDQNTVSLQQFLNFKIPSLCAYYSLLQYESTITISLLLTSHVSNGKGKYIWSN